MRKRTMFLLTLSLLAAVMAISACTGSTGSRGLQGERGGQGPQGEQGLQGDPGVGAPTIEPAPAYDSGAAQTEAYWYSRYNLGHLVMRSGMGVQLMPPMEKMQQMMEMAGIPEGPANPYLIQAPYASGDPHFINEDNGDPNDFINLRWDPDKMDKTITPQAVGYTMIKEIIWSKSFASDVEGSDPMNHFRALVLSTEAAAQANFMMTNLRAENGLFVHEWKGDSVSNAILTPQDQIVMLWALSELADYTSGKYGWYGAPLSHDQALGLADGLLTAIVTHSAMEPDFLLGMSSRDLGIALSSLSAYTSYTQDDELKGTVLEGLIPSLASELGKRINPAGRVEADGGYSQVATQGASINGLVFANKVTDNDAYRETALKVWDYMETLWDETARVYASDVAAFRYSYTSQDVADVVGAFNALLHGLNLDVEQRFADFFNGAVNLSGLQIAEGPPTGGGEDEDKIPPPPMAGAPFGQAPVFATEVVYNVATGEWTVTNPEFTTAYAMALSNQAMWIGTWAGKASVLGHGIP